LILYSLLPYQTSHFLMPLRSGIRLVLIALLINLPHMSSGQDEIANAAWLLPGSDWHPAKDVRLLGQLGYNHYFRMGIFYPQGFITVHKNIILNPAYIYAIQKNKIHATVQEHYLMNAVIFQAGKSNFSVDDRNMLWNRFTVGDRPRHYYRNRLRVTQSLKAWSATLRLYGYDEIFLLLHFKNPTRNRAALGINTDLTSHLNIDVTYIRQWDRYSGKLNLFFLAVIWQFKNSYTSIK
jgi:hypothetical protein